MAKLTVKQTAERLGMSDGHVRQMLIDGDLKGEKLGHVWMIDERTVEAFERHDAAKGDEPRRGRPRKGG